MHFANNLKAVEFYLGQKIIQAGEPVMDFFILTQGRCKVTFKVNIYITMSNRLYMRCLMNIL